MAGVRAARGNVIWIEEMLPKPDVIQILSHATVFACPSIYEPLGIVNLEAMACEAAVVATATGGIVEVVRAGYPDHTAFDAKDAHFDADSDPKQPRWFMVDVRFTRKLARPITLATLRNHSAGALKGLALLRRGNRLSVMPVSVAHWKFILGLA